MTEPIVQDKGSVELSGMQHLVASLRECRAHLEIITRQKRELESLIKARLGVAEVGTLNGVPVVTHRTTMRISVSQRELKARFPAIALECQDITEVTTFKLLDAA